MITNQPVDQAFNVGQAATFTVGATGASLTYQWRQEGTTLSDATNSLLTITNLQQTHSGIYDVVVDGADGSVTSNPARLTVNLALSDTFSNRTALVGYAFGIGLQADGKILTAGNGTPGLRRLRSDGTTDSSFNAIVGSSGAYSVSVQDDGKVLPCGQFFIARLSGSGANEGGFHPQLSYGAQLSGVYSMFQQPNGKIFIGGSFSSATGTNLTLLGADGVVDTNFSASANDIVYSVAPQLDGKILIGGVFTNVNGLRRNHIGRLNSDGTLDPDFDPGANDLIMSTIVQPDGKILMGGPFTQLGGQTRNRIARLNPDGTLDESFNPNADNFVRSMALQTDGKIIIGGDFTSVGGLTRKFVARLNSDGTVDANFNPGANATVYSLALQADGRVLVGGAFSTLAGKSRSSIGRLINPDPVMESLTFDGSSIHWVRGGCGPEVWRTSFDYSIDGGDWIKLGEGVRTADGWQLQGLNLSTNASVRARGYILAGRYQSSGGIIESKVGQLAFSIQPLSQTNNAGTTAQLTVTAQGVPPLSYQWYKDGIALSNAAEVSGATNTTLVVSNLTGLNAGAYWLVTTNSSGSITSSIANLAVVDPYIWQPPTNYIANGGETAVLAVNAAGGDLNYLWRKDGTNLMGQTVNSLTVTNAQWFDRGSYDVVVTSSFGSITSSPAILDVVLPYPAAFLSDDGSLGVRSNQFGFNIVGNAGQVTILDGSTNLIDWTPLYTNTNGFGTISFSDIGSTNFPSRFYRLRGQ